MNFLLRTFNQTLFGVSALATQFSSSLFKRNDFRIQEFIQSAAPKTSLWQLHKRGPPPHKKKKRANALGLNRPFARGIILKTLIKNPKKPNSANRKCVLVKLSVTGDEKIAFVPGIGHNLQVFLIFKISRFNFCSLLMEFTFIFRNIKQSYSKINV